MTRGFSLPHGNASVELIRVAMQPILTVHNIGHMDVECELRKPAMPNLVQSVEDLSPAEDYNLLSREPTEEDLHWLRNRLWAGSVE